ncbi:hypothetical protein CQW23_12328 [Capsicum baccatum]|uniref:Aminotransferase-like plant mobile domain-containing protein n=1 Tax=Capsicum baccatum TaxID=33114 RepID=A0A2G2WSH3_CAPBA|nr:hypothetical protein CQW23_12328 [Capsicum baccatum]
MKGNFYRPGTFKMACMMASGKMVGLALPVLSSIYSGLNKLSSSVQLNQIKVCFPIHYVYGWIAHYFRIHYPFASGSFVPTMIVYSEKGSAKYFDKNDTRKLVYDGKTPTQTTYVSKRLSQDESESSSRDHCWKRVKIHFDDARGTGPSAIKIYDDTNNPVRTISALTEEYG